MMLRQIREDIEREEGWRAHAYRDHLGFLTIGFGFLVDERRGGGLPKHIADRWLDHLLAEIGRSLDARIPWWRGQPEDVQRALVGMAYQLGISGLLNFKRMMAALERGDRLEAAAESLDSTWARQTPARARRTAALIGGEGQ